MSSVQAPLVSIITPTYQHENYIGPCIESAIRQDYSNWEQIIIDDGSRDGTAQKIKSYEDPRIRYVHQPNQGPFELAKTYNRALAISKGELIAILEGDDLWPSGKLAKLVPAFQDPEVILAYGQVSDIDPDGNVERRMSRTSRLRQSLPRPILFNDPVGSATASMLDAWMASLIAPSTVIIRRRALDQIGGFQYVDDLPTTDYPTFLELSLIGRFFYEHGVMGHRRWHVTSVTANHGDSVFEKTYMVALGFIEKHKNDIQLTIAQRRTIERSWERSRSTLRFSQGRKLLAQGKWQDARPLLRTAMGSADSAVAVAASIAFASSYLHVTIEPLMRLMGRVDLRV